ncbi:MAG TPA: restriction endonuclease [Pseudomonas sp.]|jgi:restriction system protein|uniref:restriction endonuclease n=1 Tax=Stutzerimonas xanthomarina TaxID=271420 RepID=UPI000E8FAB76|nr:restriction endonuclease [Stutzerimonas xanthomarina]MBU0812545.1 restriction endonuclease [Gammaproteobacteria bacterium]HAQ89250.1 restriction endonuclease [Pseudomonas sp.]MBK3849501.1 restriction endonuclease [Stutzerimonas xanthomarina]MBU0854006.1 restriction endonuclease [Gammaproteobacteria bacterium]MBU1302250.1 restriction endonuclease [Gammaproteobacteria bacterium]|tara:strand:- start:154 stop:1089 length:936 start_codon:yes stop_codon:yes gene_type:complete
MSVPTYDQFIEPILRFLAARPEGATAGEAHEAAAQALGLSEAQRQETTNSGQATYKTRAGWAHDRLKRAGFSSSAKHGYWKLTGDGLAFAQSNQAPLGPEQVKHLAMNYMSVKLKPAPDAASLDESSDTQALITQAEIATSSPQERLDQALLELRTSVAGDLLDSLLQASPTRFEHIVLDVLHSLGYGANRQALQQVGGSGDGGIDGMISLDALGLEKVYVQAKRWQSTVGRPELQAFYGALAGQKARRGVFMTTSGFTAQAVEFARSVEGLVLVDGKRLVNLMLDHEVGVSSQLFKVPRLDSDYFDESLG